MSGPRRPSQYWVSAQQVISNPPKKMKENLLWCEWYQHVPAWSGTVKSYKNESSGIIGHWATPTGPSAKLVLCWNIPCQCYNCVRRWGNQWLRITPTYNTCASKHSRVRQSVNHIQFKTIALKFFDDDEFDCWTEKLLNVPWCLWLSVQGTTRRPWWHLQEQYWRKS